MRDSCLFITHPLILEGLYWLLYVTFCKLPDHAITPNLVPRAFPFEIETGGKRPWHRLVTWSFINISWPLIYVIDVKSSIVIGCWNSPQKYKLSLIEAAIGGWWAIESGKSNTFSVLKTLVWSRRLLKSFILEIRCVGCVVVRTKAVTCCGF